MQISQSNIPFKMNLSGFKYLGVNVAKSYKSLYISNDSPLLSEIKVGFQRWASLPLSLMGRINIVKMNILPKSLFLFQNLPLSLPERRVGLKVLQNCKSDGGLSLSNFIFYYWSVNIVKTAFWLKSVDIHRCNLETQSCSSSSLRALLTGSLSVNPSGFISSLVVISTLNIWFQFKKQLKLVAPTISFPLLQNHAFNPAFTDPVFTLWHEKGLICFKDFYKDGIFCSFMGLASGFNLPPSHLFRYFQVRNCVKSLFCNFPQLPSQQTRDGLLQLNPIKKSFISKVYHIIQSYDDYLTTKAKGAWERE